MFSIRTWGYLLQQRCIPIIAKISKYQMPNDQMPNLILDITSVASSGIIAEWDNKRKYLNICFDSKRQ